LGLWWKTALTSFLAIQHYSPLLVLVTGVSTFVGLWGVGTAILLCVRLRLPAPWNHVAAVLLGIQAFSLAVQVVGMAGMTSRSVLSAMWWALIACGAAMLLLRERPMIVTPFSATDKSALLPTTIAGIAVATNLLVAIAPSTKADELYYHMLVPSRIVSDGALHFYRVPWEGAIWPHMTFQIAAAPAHAMGLPDAANVVSWGLSVTLVWFAWRIIRDNAKSAGWAALWTASLCVGMYPVVWHVTGGAHAMGDLAMAAAVVAFASRERLLGTITPSAYAALLSTLLLSASVSKVSLLPLSVVLLLVAVWPLLWRARPPVSHQVVLAVAAPWIVFFCPIALWTWMQSGSPLGPMLAGMFGPSIYRDGWVQKAFQLTRDANQGPLTAVARHAAFLYSPLVFLGAIGAIAGTDLLRGTRLILCCLLAMQSFLIYWLLPPDLRFLSGLQFGLTIVFASFAVREIRSRFACVRFMAACAMLVPWLGIQLYYAKQFFPVSLGLERTAFYDRYVAFYEDYVKLDRLLPKDAVLLAQDFWVSAAYAPRPIFFDSADLPPGKQAVLFGPSGSLPAIRSSLGPYRPGSLMYENARAITRTFRTPGRRPVIGSIRVIALIPTE
jgi:hypothetical protein